MLREDRWMLDGNESQMRAEVNKEKIERFMQALGRAPHSPGRVYFTGGVSAVLHGWRNMTVDVDFKLDPEPMGVFDALPKLKDELEINVELAAPDDFIPALPGWHERSSYITTCGKIQFYHYDFYSQAMAKLERFHARDQSDIKEMVKGGLIERRKLLELFQEIEPQIKRYPAIEPAAFRARVEAFVAEEADDV